MNQNENYLLDKETACSSSLTVGYRERFTGVEDDEPNGKKLGEKKSSARLHHLIFVIIGMYMIDIY